MVRSACVFVVILLIVGFFRGWFSYSVHSDQIHSDLQKAEQRLAK